MILVIVPQLGRKSLASYHLPECHNFLIWCPKKTKYLHKWRKLIQLSPPLPGSEPGKRVEPGQVGWALVWGCSQSYFLAYCLHYQWIMQNFQENANFLSSLPSSSGKLPLTVAKIKTYLSMMLWFARLLGREGEIEIKKINLYVVI